MLTLLLFLAQSWVVKDALPPVPRTSGSEFGFGSAVASGDLDADGCVEAYLHATEFPFSEDMIGLIQGGPRAGRIEFSMMAYRFNHGGPQVPRVAILRTPHGLIAAYHDLQSGLLQTRRITAPNTVVAVSPSLQPGAFVRFPDVNGDGWEDLFCQDYLHEGYPMMVDGRTLTAIWRKVIPSSENPSMLTRNTAQEPQDIDGDLIPDPIAVWTSYYPQTGSWDHSAQAFSGATGAQLWENRASTSRGLTLPAVGEHDLTGDAIHDLILANGYVIKLVSGADGATIWSFNPSGILQAAGPPGWTYIQPLYPAVLTWDPSAAAMRLVLPIKYWQVQVSSVYRVEFAHFDPYTGAFLNFAMLPANLQPWFADTFENLRGDSPICALGDLDRDGLQEISFGVPAPAYDVVFNGHVPKHFVTLGLRTLDIPSQLRIGVSAQMEVTIPSAPHHDFFLIGSRFFDRRGGVRLEGWRTHLADDPWLTWSTASRAFAGTLDGAGSGQVLVAVPPNPSLVGSTLYSRVVVLAPGGQEIWTLSTLGISEIVP